MTSEMQLHHVAVAIGPDGLQPAGRSALVDFYGEVFGWREITGLARPDRLVLAISPSQYLTIRNGDEPMRGSGSEHFGVALPTRVALEALHERARRYSERDPHVEIGALESSGGLHVFRVRYGLPVSVEVMYLEPDVKP
ncbi:MAG: VOC family protein [Proteobacteria bacterium]|nr:VOC family protein [Pseudomonadota bacterium]